MGSSGGIPGGLPERRIVPSPHSSLGPKLQVFDVVDRGPGVDAEAPKPRSIVYIDPMPTGGR